MIWNRRVMTTPARFARDDRGNVMVLFAFSIVALLAAIGLAVDGSRGFTVRAELRAALDAAGLAVARDFSILTSDPAYQTSSGDVDVNSLEVWAADFVNEYLAANFDEGFFSSDTVNSDTTIVSLVVDNADNPGQITLSANTTMPTYLLGLVEVDQIDVAVQGSYTIGGTGGTLEVALVIDNSGSTTWANIETALRNAVTALMDELIPCDGAVCTSDDVHVSLVPFRQNVRLDPNAAYLSSWDTTALPSAGWNGCLDARHTPVTDVNGNDIHDLYEGLDLCGDNMDCVEGREHSFFDYFLDSIGSSDQADFLATYSPAFPYLESARGGLAAPDQPAAALDFYHVSHLDDAPPISADEMGTPLVRFRRSGGYTGYYDADSTLTAVEQTYRTTRYHTNGYTYHACGNTLRGPTNDRSVIDAEMADGTWSPDNATSMDLGMAWGWRTVSPRWQGYWGLGNDLPRNYGAPSNTKTVVMVTDGFESAFGRDIAGACPTDRPDLAGHTAETCSNRTPYTEYSLDIFDTSVAHDRLRYREFQHYYRHRVNLLLVCEQMRDVDIEVVVVYLESPNNQQNQREQAEYRPVYEACATQVTDSHARPGQQYFFAVRTAEELADIFANLGQSLSSLRIAQ